MTFHIAKTVRQFSSLLPKAPLPLLTKTVPAKPRVMPSYLIPSVGTLTIRSVHRPFSTSVDNSEEPDLYSPPSFVLNDRNELRPTDPPLVAESKRILRHFMVTFEAHQETLSTKVAGPEIIKESLSRHFFKDDLKFAEHIIRFFESIDPNRRKGADLIQVITAYADCRAHLLAQNRAIKYFQFYNPFLTMIPPEISLFHQLETLDLSNNSIKSLPSVLFDEEKPLFPHLSSLDLSHNPISSVGPILTHCPALKLLYLTGNRLHKLSESLYKLTSLEYLDLSYNHLKEIPPQLFTLPLTHLRISHNHINKLPKLFYNDTSNQDGVSDSDLKLFQSLEHLNLSHNLLADFLSYKAFPNLISLNLSHNQLENFEILRSKNLALKHLNLQANKIGTLQAEPHTDGSLGIELLDISSNPINVLDPELMRDIPKILHRPPIKRPSPTDMIGC